MTFQTLGHTSISTMVAPGAGIKVMKFAGHTQIRTTEQYFNNITDSREQAAESPNFAGIFLRSAALRRASSVRSVRSYLTYAQAIPVLYRPTRLARFRIFLLTEDYRNVTGMAEHPRAFLPRDTRHSLQAPIENLFDSRDGLSPKRHPTPLLTGSGSQSRGFRSSGIAWLPK